MKPDNNYNLIPKYIRTNLMKFIAGAVILSLVLVASVGWNVWNMYGNFSKVVTTEFQLQSLTSEIVYLDEVLTMSARMAAATGNLDWKDRYEKYEPQLDRAIKKAIDIAPETYQQHATKTDAANIKLVAMEQKSFDLLNQGRSRAAYQILFGEEYEREKQVYSEGITETVRDLETRIQSNLGYYQQSLFTSSLFSLLSFPILSLAWICILKLVNWYVQQQKQGKIALQIAKLELERVNKNLEDKVAVRTAQLREVNKNLEDKVRKRTAQLREANQTLHVANQSKDRFIANISHELRTPLNSILGYTKIMSRNLARSSSSPGLSHEERIKNLNIIKNSGTHLLNLINDILEYSKSEAGKIELNPQPLNLPKFLRETSDLVESWAKEKGLQLIIEKEQNLPEIIEADKKRLRQVLINLLSNAIKFTDTGKIILKVRQLDTSNFSHRKKLRFEVIDTGIGISKAKIQQIFAPFEQLGDNESKAAGTGLGLSISSQLVELMGGKLSVASKINSGSTFWFEAIFNVVESSSPEWKIKTKTDNYEIVSYHGRERKLLVVDDKKENRSLLRDMLEPIGFKILSAENGQQMLNIAKVVPPDLVLLDLFMPVKTGFTSAKEFRHRPEFKDIPVFIISASSVTEATRKYLECDAYLHKPIDEEKLFDLLEQYLSLEWVYQKVS